FDQIDLTRQIVPPRRRLQFNPTGGLAGLLTAECREDAEHLVAVDFDAQQSLELGKPQYHGRCLGQLRSGVNRTGDNFATATADDDFADASTRPVDSFGIDSALKTERRRAEQLQLASRPPHR